MYLFVVKYFYTITYFRSAIEKSNFIYFVALSKCESFRIEFVNLCKTFHRRHKDNDLIIIIIDSQRLLYCTVPQLIISVKKLLKEKLSTSNCICEQLIVG